MNPTAVFAIDRFVVSVNAWPSLLGAVAERLELLHRSSNHLGSAADLEFQYTTGNPVLSVPPGSRTIYEFAEGVVIYDPDGDRLHVSIPGVAVATCDRDRSSTVLTRDAHDAQILWWLSRPFMTVQLGEMLKRRGLFPIHAAAVAYCGQGVLIAGSSGAGKSTLTFALMMAGFDALGDDTTFIDPAGASLRLVGFPDEASLSTVSMQLLSTTHVARIGDVPDSSKHRVRLHSVPGCRILPTVPPAVVIFPEVARSGNSTLTQLTTDEAFLMLASNVLLTERSSTAAHLEVLARLARECRCFRLVSTPRLDESVRLITAAIEAEHTTLA